MQPIGFQDVDITGGFWQQIQQRNRKTTVYAVRDRFADTGRFEAFNFSWKEGMPNKPHIFWDSDIAKWAESVAYILQKGPDDELQADVERVIDCIAAHQEESGYFNIYFTVCEPEARLTRRTDHELYCAGHLIEAAVAYYQATGRDRFLRQMCRYADYIDRVFRLEGSAPFVTPGHEEIELALVKLYRCTGQQRYLELAQFFVDQRGANDKDLGKEYPFAHRSYSQSHLPVRQQRTAEGHSVRACYLYCAMADLAAICQDGALLDACRALFDNITTRRMYITGGIGQSHHGEAFTVDYDLPNRTAYAETCAAISLAFFAQRMLTLQADGRYGDVIERALYNGILSGISLDGESFFYENPLSMRPGLNQHDTSVREGDRYPITQRVKVFECSCCPPNLTRLFATLGDYLYGRQDGVVYVHQFMDSRFDKDGVSVRQRTRYPQNGVIHLQAQGVDTLAVRIPGWCRAFTASAPYTLKDGYAYFQGQRELTVEFSMEPVLMRASEQVSQDAGKVAVQMGPIVYCAEGVDNGEHLSSLHLSAQGGFEAAFDPAFGANVITAQGFRPEPAADLYSPYEDKWQAVPVKLIPYFAFANRGPSEMQVWMPVR